MNNLMIMGPTGMIGSLALEYAIKRKEVDRAVRKAEGILKE